MRKIKTQLIIAILMLILPISSLNLNANVLDDYEYTGSQILDINNPSQQTSEYIAEDGTKYTLILEKETVTRNTSENWPIGTHSRRISATNDVTTMSAVINVTINPYTTTFHSIGQGRYTSVAGTWLRNEYEVNRYTSHAPQSSIGTYYAYYSSFLGTHAAKLLINVYSSGNVTAAVLGVW